MHLKPSSLQNWRNLFCRNKTPITYLDEFDGVKISVKRDDLNHMIVQGNKLRKLKYNFKYAINHNFSEVATFGGAWSNHILATAQAANICDLNSIGFIRGDELKNCPDKWSKTLRLAKKVGMQLIFLDRQQYRKKQESTTVMSYLEDKENQSYVIPEGGSNLLALKGVGEVIIELKIQIPEPTHIVTACGTGGTFAGLIDGVSEMGWGTKIIGVPVLKGAQFLQKDIEDLSKYYQKVSWQLCYEYHCGGYAKINNEVMKFGLKFMQDTDVDLDKIYNAKSFYAVYDLIKKGVIIPGSHVVILHTGGLQGGLVSEL